MNELITVTRNATNALTVAGTTTSLATNVAVNTSNAVLYSDSTFASPGFTVANGNNNFTAIAKDNYGCVDSNSVTVNLPATNNFAYDLNGNMLTNGTRSFEYDLPREIGQTTPARCLTPSTSEQAAAALATNDYLTGRKNQLIRITEPSAWKSEFAYDGKMRRRIRKEFTWSSGAWVRTNETRYIYDGTLIIQDRDPNNLPQVTYTRGRDLSGSFQGAGGIGGLLARTDNSLSTINDSQSTSYYHCDWIGNVTCLINQSQQIVAKYLYDPFGNIISISGILAEANLYRFSSKEADPNSGLTYYLYRYYEPQLQRWLGRDPAGEKGGLNLYLDVGNDAINRVDLDGRGVVDCGKALADLAAAIATVDARIAAIKLHGGDPDPGHQKALDQACDRLNNALERVKKHCGCIAGAAALATAATAALEAAAAYLPTLIIVIAF